MVFFEFFFLKMKNKKNILLELYYKIIIFCFKISILANIIIYFILILFMMNI